MQAPRSLNTTLYAAAVCVGVACTLPLQAEPEISSVLITHGVAIGDVQTDRAVIWSRADRDATLHVRVKAHGVEPLHEEVNVTSAHDYAGAVTMKGLKPDTAYEYRVWFDNEDKKNGDDKRNTVTGSFRTTPQINKERAVAFAWGGDLAGQNVCRDASEGFPIFKTINTLELDFFVGLGDMIYADGVCSATGLYGNAQVPGAFERAATLADFWAHWKYNRDDDAYRTLLGKLPYYAIWDDHEVVNDFGPLHGAAVYPRRAPDADGPASVPRLQPG